MGGAPWYDSAEEYVTAEIIILLVLVHGALFFEYLHHRVSHHIDHVSYGVKAVYEDQIDHDEHETDPDEHLPASAHVIGEQAHSERLFSRINGEIMVLGFLSASVWVLNQTGALQSIAKQLGDKPDHTSLLHLTEDVHMFLFAAMIFNFVLAFALVRQAVMWQLLFARLEHPQLVDSAHWGTRREPNRRPEFLSDAEHWRKLKTYFVQVLRAEGHDTIDDSFDFARYISACVDQILADVVHFSGWTWALVVLIFGLNLIFTSTIDFGSANTLEGVEIMQAASCATCPLLGFVLAKYTRRHLRKICEKSDAGDFSKNNRLGSRISVELIVARVMQALMFVVCYSTSRLIFSKRFWTGEMYHSSPAGVVSGILVALFYVTMFAVTGLHILPNALASSAVCFALPPYVDSGNWHVADACMKYTRKFPDHWTRVIREARQSAHGVAQVVPLATMPHESSRDQDAKHGSGLGGD